MFGAGKVALRAHEVAAEKLQNAFSCGNESLVACMHVIPFQNCLLTPQVAPYVTRTQSIK